MHLRILNPCPMKWDELTATGDFGLRACEKCHKNVKDLTGLEEDEAIAYVRAAQARGQRVCGRAEVRNGRLVFIAAAAAIMASVATVSGCSAEPGETGTGEEQTPSSPAAAAAPIPECEGGACEMHMMGDVEIAQ
jgi:hypothetical protein